MAGPGSVPRDRFKAWCYSCDWYWYGATQEAVIGAVKRHACESEFIDVKSASGQTVVQTQTAGPGWRRLPPTVGPKGPAGNSGANRGWKAPAPTVREEVRRTIYGPVEGRKPVSRETPEPYVEVWRSMIFGWHGRLMYGDMALEQWWRPFKRFAEYRGSYVHLRYLEHSQRERVT